MGGFFHHSDGVDLPVWRGVESVEPHEPGPSAQLPLFLHGLGLACVHD